MEIIEVCEALIKNDKQQILLHLRDNKSEIHGPGKWSVLGGGKEVDEIEHDCLIREIKEKIGLIVEPNWLATVMDSDGQKMRRHHLYGVKYNGPAESLLLGEGQMVKFFSFSELIELDKVSWFEKVYLSTIKKFLN